MNTMNDAGGGAFGVVPVLGRAQNLSAPVPALHPPRGVEKIIAHRGGAGLAHENTFEAFHGAWNMGIRIFETDVHISSDAVAMCFHDDTLDRVTNLTGRPEHHSWDVLAAAQVDDPHLPHVPPSRIYRIDELLGDFPEAQLIIDVKTPAQVGPLAEAMRRAHASHRVCVTHAWDSWLEHIREQVGPSTERCLGWENVARLVRAVQSGHSTGRIQRELHDIRVANYVHIGWQVGSRPLMSDQDFSRRFVDAAHALGLIVRVWTINRGEHMDRLWDDGVDAIFTDRPDVALHRLDELSARSSPASM